MSSILYIVISLLPSATAGNGFYRHTANAGRANRLREEAMPGHCLHIACRAIHSRLRKRQCRMMSQSGEETEGE